MAEAELTILVGTMTGTAELVAEELRDAFAGKGIGSEILPMDGLDETVFERPSPFLICTSTYGQGDVPDNARDFFERLSAARPELTSLHFGVIALGDRTYAQTYCHGGHKFDALLRELGAQRIGDVLEHDASAGTIPEEVAVNWAGPWAEACLESLKKAD
jgi:MioC protein